MLGYAIYFSLYWIAGFALKSGDDMLDVLDRPRLSLIPLSVAGAAFGLLMTNSEWDFALLTAIILGVLVSGKINRPQFGIGFLIIGLFLMLSGVPYMSSVPVAIAVVSMLLIAAAVDEYANDRMGQQSNRWKRVIFRYRFVLKCVALCISVIWYGFLLAAIGLWVFDTGYEMAGAIISRQWEHA